MYKEYQKNLSSTAVVAGLIATLSFLGVLMPPTSLAGGGTALPTAQLALFLYCNTFAFCLALVAVFVMTLTTPESTELRKWTKRWAWVGLLVMLAGICFAMAYMAAAYVAFGPIMTRHCIAVISIATCAVGAYFCVLFIKLLPCFH